MSTTLDSAVPIPLETGFAKLARWITRRCVGRIDPPENITLHGARDFMSGGEIGSVSAASSAFSAQIGKQFKRVANTLIKGSNPVARSRIFDGLSCQEPFVLTCRMACERLFT
jgi:hypothetical protein